MKTEELTAIGLTEEQATQVLAMNGKDIEKHKKQITTVEGERDAFKAQLDTANETLKKFEGIDPQQIQTELQTYKTKAEEAEKKYTREMTQRDQKDWIGKKLDEYGVTSPYARRQLTSDIMAEESGLSWRDGAYFGFDDFMKSAKEKDNSLYQTAEEKAAAEKEAAQKAKAPTFTGPTSDPAGGGEKKFTPPKVF
ncbi:MAG: phage scaffolding protein [Clostridia bacterium]|nr:phage scaffolding protein [Clostridia bacterium]